MSGTSLSRTTIRILDADSRKTLQTSRTGSDGQFNLTGLPPGHYLVSFSSSGFSPELLDVDTSQPAATAFHTVRMHMRDCDDPEMSCDSFGVQLPPDPHPVAAKGPVTVAVLGAVNLDKAALVQSMSPLADIGLSQEDSRLYLNSLNGTAILSECRPVYGRRRIKNQLMQFRVDGLDPDTEICLKTKRGRFSKLYLTTEVVAGDHQLIVYIVTRE